MKVLNEQIQDTHAAVVLAESKKSASVKRWAPVLNKCREIPRSKLALVASLLESQQKAWDPANRTMLFEDVTTTANIADFTRFALPLIRKSYAKLIADEIVGVQPMSQPASLIFYIRFRYAMTKGQTVAGTQIMRQNTSAAYARNNGWALDPYYSSQTVKGETASITTGNTVVAATLAHRPILAGTVVVNVFASAATATPDCDNGTPLLTVSFGANGAADYIQYADDSSIAWTVEESATEFNSTTGAVTITVTGGSFPSEAVALVNYEYDLEANPFQPQLTLSIDNDSVAAQTRKLKTAWSLEAAQDLKSVQNLDAEATLTDLMADEMVAEIDREILNDLIVAAAVRANHNFGTAAGASVNFTDRNIALLYKTLEVSNVIHRTTLRSPANFAVTSADIASKYEQLNDFRGSDALGTEGLDLGVVNSGTIQSKIKLYKDPLFPKCKVLVGFKGKTALDAGFIYAPYIPLLSTPTVLDPNSMTPNKGILTRYGKKLLEDGGLYYGVLNVSNIA